MLPKSTKLHIKHNKSKTFTDISVVYSTAYRYKITCFPFMTHKYGIKSSPCSWGNSTVAMYRRLGIVVFNFFTCVTLRLSIRMIRCNYFQMLLLVSLTVSQRLCSWLWSRNENVLISSTLQRSLKFPILKGWKIWLDKVSNLSVLQPKSGKNK